MAKFYGHIGFAAPINDERPGITYDDIVERPYYGEVIRNVRRVQSGDTVNADLALSNQISIVVDPYLANNFYNIRYLTFMGAKWSVTNIEMRYPRMNIDIGGLYAEQSHEGSSDFM